MDLLCCAAGIRRSRRSLGPAFAPIPEQDPEHDSAEASQLGGESQEISSNSSAAIDSEIVIRVIEAEFTRSFDAFGFMDPFVTVDIVTKAGSRRQLARTGTHWMGHLHPVWDFQCPVQSYTSSSAAPTNTVSRADHIDFQVFEESYGGFGRPTFCGATQVQVQELLAGDQQIPKRLDLKRQTDHGADGISGFLSVRASLQPLRPNGAVVLAESEASVGGSSTPKSSVSSRSGSTGVFAASPYGKSRLPKSDSRRSPSPTSSDDEGSMSPAETVARAMGKLRATMQAEASGSSSSSSRPPGISLAHAAVPMAGGPGSRRSVSLGQASTQIASESELSEVSSGHCSAQRESGLEESPSFEVLVDRVRETAAKFPQAGCDYFTSAQPRFFAVTCSSGSEAEAHVRAFSGGMFPPPPRGGASGRPRLAFWEDEEAWRRGDDALGTLLLANISEAVVEDAGGASPSRPPREGCTVSMFHSLELPDEHELQQATPQGHAVTRVISQRLTSQPSDRTSCMVLRFRSRERATAWASDVNALAGMARRLCL